MFNNDSGVLCGLGRQERKEVRGVVKSRTGGGSGRGTTSSTRLGLHWDSTSLSYLTLLAAAVCLANDNVTTQQMQATSDCDI
jgi:hypothetical protein